MIHLDTCYLIHAIEGATTEDRHLRSWIRSRESLAISAVAWAEFQCGPRRPDADLLARAIVGDVVPVGAGAAERAAALFNAGGRRRGSLMDCLVAACAIEADAALATSNHADFRRFVQHGLRLAA